LLDVGGLRLPPVAEIYLVWGFESKVLKATKGEVTTVMASYESEGGGMFLSTRWK